MKCPSCGGTLYFDIKNQNLKCHSCSAVFQVDEYARNNNAEETLLADGRMYTCQNCGAELISADDEAVTYCSYCGSQQILESEISGIKQPKYIIPFKITKQKCKNIYQDAVKNKLYVPSEFKDPEFIERFRPFYIPYWMYQVKFRPDEFEVDGSRSYTSRGYDYYEDYVVKARVKDRGLYGIPYDASRNFDDSIAEAIAPFARREMVDYNPAYLAGVYADAPNVDAETYKEEVLNDATRKAIGDIQQSVPTIMLKLPSSLKKQKEFLDARYDGEDAIYLPVWFLTWRKNKRVAYAVVNGQNGKIHIDMPVDFSVFLRYTLFGAILLFVLLSLFVTVTSRFVLWFAAMLLYLVGRRYRKELILIRDRENHVFDKGYLLSDRKELPMSEKKRSRLRSRAEKSWSSLSDIVKISLLIMLGIFIFSAGGALYDDLVSQSGAIAMTFLVLIAEIISFFRTFAVSIYLKKKRSLLVNFMALSAIIYAFSVAAAEPVQDYWYYLGGLISLAVACIMCIDMIVRFNETSTRPLPSFYSRKGGNDSAKN